jgi:hypothetical protein
VLETKSDPAATLVVEAAAETLGPGSWAIAYETINSAQINKMRFIVSLVRIARRRTSLHAPAAAASDNLVLDGENCDGLKFMSTPDAIAAHSLPVSGGARDKNVFRF